MSDLRSILLFLLLLPVVSLAQTAHVKDGKITYAGTIQMPGLNDDIIIQKAKDILLKYVNANPDSLKEKNEKGELSTTGIVQIPTAYQTVKKFRYKVNLQTKGNEISYEIGDIQLMIGKRGKKLKIMPSEHLVKGMEENGLVATQTEKTLNEIDMHIQKLIARMKGEGI